MLKRPLLQIGFVALLLFSAAHAEVLAPHELYASNNNYIVTRGETPVGIHRLTFGGDDKQLEVVTQTRATLRLLGLFDVPFIYDSRALWQSNSLLTLSSSFARGGAPRLSRAHKDGNIYRTNNQEIAPPPLFPTNHWNINAMHQTLLFNTLSGDLIHVTIVPDKKETLTIGEQRIMTQRYQVSGDLDIVLWYDKNGKWLQLQFSVLGSDYKLTYQPDK